ncbi:hypothetical protein [Actinomadura bangladeshensis]|uniref:DUF2771 family protein n=1 Tax=Actinomadura bangladeshensis TaxID=453573 RepID=A0A4R4NT67_9ACTN|nr:hypothetical protein [Actinomadura bangladeshensis]TDC12868.1 hypothetical protein E1284_21940 [Actinomadura bangladeshensis]
MRIRALLLAALMLTAAACTGTPRPEQADGATGRPTAAPPGDLANPRIMNCANRNASFPEEGDGPVKTGPGDLVVEPLIISGLRTWADADPIGHGRDGRYKVGVVLRAGKTATLSIPAEYHAAAGLLYSEAAQGARTPAEADHAITFTACPDHDTPFPGYLFVPRHQHVPLVVRPEGGPATREMISFFAGR